MKSNQRIHYRDDRTRYFFDTEFMEDGKTVELLSIGIVCDDGREYYAINSEADRSKANDWVKANVLPHLPAEGSGWWKTREVIRDEIVRFIRAGKRAPEFWAYFADYDWLVFCQLFGRMVDLPQGFPQFCMDLKQLAVELGSPPLPQQVGTEHHALDDARTNRALFDMLRAYGDTEGETPSVDRQTLREFQRALPWGANTYSKDFEADPAEHKQYRHDVGHLIKTVGKLADLPFELDHDTAIAARYRDEDSKRLADLVIFAMHMASTHPSGAIDLAAEIEKRVAQTREKLEAQRELARRAQFVRQR